MAANNAALAARPTGQALQNRFGSSYFGTPASNPPYSHASPSISPRPNLGLAQSVRSSQYDSWTHAKSFQADANLMAVFQNQPDLIIGPNQLREKMAGPNMNNNNFVRGMRESRSLPRPGPPHFGDLNRSVSVSADAMQRNFASDSAPMLFQNSLRLNENTDARGTLVGNAMQPRSPGISPVGSRQRKVKTEILQQHHASNTWPFLQEFGAFPPENAGGKDREYQKYVAELRNAAMRKQTQSPVAHPFDTADVVAWNNRILWENQCLEQPLSNPRSFNNGNGSSTGPGDILSSISDMSSEQFKTGTWPGTFQLWPSTDDNAGIWEWRNDSGRDGE